jgi:hypothetical protein
MNTLNWNTTIYSGSNNDIDYILPAEGISVLCETFEGIFFTGYICFSEGALFISILPNGKETSCEINPKNIKQWSYIDDKNNKIIEW